MVKYSDGTDQTGCKAGLPPPTVGFHPGSDRTDDIGSKQSGSRIGLFHDCLLSPWARCYGGDQGGCLTAASHSPDKEDVDDGNDPEAKNINTND